MYDRIACNEIKSSRIQKKNNEPNNGKHKSYNNHSIDQLSNVRHKFYVYKVKAVSNFSFISCLRYILKWYGNTRTQHTMVRQEHPFQDELRWYARLRSSLLFYNTPRV